MATEDLMENKMLLLNNLKNLRGLDEDGNSGTVDLNLLLVFFYRGQLGSNNKKHIEDLSPGFYYKLSFEDNSYESEYPYADGVVICLFVHTAKIIFFFRYNGEVTAKIKWGGFWYTSIIK